MLRKIALLCVLLVFALVSTVSVNAAEKKGGEGKKEAKSKSSSEIKDEFIETTHDVVIDGKKIAYKATTGTIAWKKDTETPKATVFFIAYTRIDTEGDRDRPLTFSFNGGPGSSSVWLHLGVLGPRRVLMDDDGNSLAPPYNLIDNDQSILDKTDLVFIDPVGTGFSRAVEGEDEHQFHGLDEDIESVGEFIRLYVTKNQRWGSPKFLIGESYGTTRAAGLSGYLQRNHGMYLNGIMLISSILDFQTARFNTGNDLPYILFLPTYTATAWYHNQLASELQADLEKTLDRSEQFARGRYATALLAGDAIDPVEKKAIIKELASLTGLSEEYVEQTNMRIKIWRFTKELLRDQKRTTGRLDSRFLGMDYDAAGESYDYDPSYAAIQGSFSTLLNEYVSGELNFKSDLPYEILTGRVHPWSYKRYQNRYVNTAETMRDAMTKNPDLKIFVANGYYDLATPYFATEYTFNHLGLDPSLRDNVTMAYYRSGHMMYIHLESLHKLRGDLVKFLEGAVGTK